MNSNNNNSNNKNLEFLDILTICSFILQLQNMESSSKHFKQIEEKINYIIKNLNLNKENLWLTDERPVTTHIILMN